MAALFHCFDAVRDALRAVKKRGIKSTFYSRRVHVLLKKYLDAKRSRGEKRMDYSPQRVSTVFLSVLISEACSHTDPRMWG